MKKSKVRWVLKNSMHPYYKAGHNHLANEMRRLVMKSFKQLYKSNAKPSLLNIKVAVIKTFRLEYDDRMTNTAEKALFDILYKLRRLYDR